MSRYFFACLTLLGLLGAPKMSVADTAIPVRAECDESRPAIRYVAGPEGSAALPLGLPRVSMTPCYIDTDLGSSEPYLQIKRDGTVVFAPVHLPNGDLGVMRSSDDGATWKATVPRLPDGRSHGRFQPYLYMDPITERLIFTTSRLQFRPLTINTGLHSSLSDDGGQTWRYRLIDAFKGPDWTKISQGPGTVSGQPTVTYLSGPTPISTPAVVVVPRWHQVLKSYDGGESWQEAGGFDITLKGNRCAQTEYIHFGTSVVTPDGTLHIAGRRCEAIGLASSTDEGKTWTVRDVPGTRLIRGGTTLAIPFNPNYVLTQPLTVDSEGNLYVLYPDETNRLRLTVSRDNARTWSTPVVVSAPHIRRTHLASLAIKAPGQVAVLYYGSEESTSSGTFDAYVAESSNAFSVMPLFTSQVINRPGEPMMKGFDANYINMFFGGDVIEISQAKYAPNGDLYVSLVKDMCPDGRRCEWDFNARARSKFKGVIGRIRH